MVRICVFELRQLGRAMFWPIAIVLTVWIVVLELQRPAFARGPGTVRFTWNSLESALVLMIFAMPLVWLAVRRSSGGHARRAVGSAKLAFARFVAMAVAMTVMIAAAASTAALISNTLHRIYAWGPALEVMARCFVIAVPTAALAPALSAWPGPRIAAVASWFVLGVASLGPFGFGIPIPIDRALAGTSGPSATVYFAAVLATVAGLTVSVAMFTRSRAS